MTASGGMHTLNMAVKLHLDHVDSFWMSLSRQAGPRLDSDRTPFGLTEYHGTGSDHISTLCRTRHKLCRVSITVLPVHHVQETTRLLGTDWCQKLLWRVRRRGLGRVGGITAREHKFMTCTQAAGGVCCAVLNVCCTVLNVCCIVLNVCWCLINFALSVIYF